MLRLLAGLALYQTAEIRTTVPLVVTPVAVTDRDGKPVTGLAEEDFVVYDGRNVARHRLEVFNQPISLVIAIQNNPLSGPALAKLVKVGGMVQPLVSGEDGRVAVVTFNDTVETHLDFTSDVQKISEAFHSLRPQGSAAAMLDAVGYSLNLLAAEETSRRKVLIVIGESKDRGSETRLDDVIAQALKSNVTIYHAGFSAYLTSFTTRGSERFGTAPNEPRVYQPGASGLSLLAIISELARLGKENSAAALTKATGGEKLSFLRLKGLEEVVTRLGEELHNQYVLTFSPASGEPGYRDLRVAVRNRLGVNVRSRPGYWLQN